MNVLYIIISTSITFVYKIKAYIHFFRLIPMPFCPNLLSLLSLIKKREKISKEVYFEGNESLVEVEDSGLVGSHGGGGGL